MFKDIIKVDNLIDLSKEITDNIESLDEFGYCSVHPNDQEKIQNLSSELKDLLDRSLEILEELNKEMVDSYGN